MDFTSVLGNPESGRVIVTLMGLIKCIRKTYVRNGYVHTSDIVTCTVFACRKNNFFMKAIDFFFQVSCIVTKQRPCAAVRGEACCSLRTRVFTYIELRLSPIGQHQDHLRSLCNV